MSLKRLLYTLLLYLIFPLVLLRLLMRSRSNSDYRKRWSERLGLIKNNHQSVIWVHAVSVGEAIASKPLIEELLATYSTIPILVTTTTPTGSDRVKALFADQIKNKQLLHVYFPYDLLGSVSRFISAFRPQILIVVETEIWPNLYAGCHQRGIPVVMVNARLSDKSTHSYLKIKSLVAETLANVSVIAVRSANDSERFVQLGAKPSQLRECGNIKYDICVDQSQVLKADKYLNTWNKNEKRKRLVFVAASTHKGEDIKILGAYLKLLEQFPDLILVVVPRHPERFDEVYNDCVEQLPSNIHVIRHSQSNNYKNQKVKVILGDTMGEMQMWYATADIVFIGGSLVKTGGHNPLEATLFGVPVVSGPHMFNFDDIAKEQSTAELLFICDNEFKIYNKLSQLLTAKSVLKENEPPIDVFIEKANKFMLQHQGVTARLLTIISRLIK